jgi:hypothetical protein
LLFGLLSHLARAAVLVEAQVDPEVQVALVEAQVDPEVQVALVEAQEVLRVEVPRELVAHQVLDLVALLSQVIQPQA